MVPVIDAHELKGRIDTCEDFIILDVRDTPDFARDHLPGASHMLISDMNEKSLEGFDTAVEIVTYSEDEDCPASGIAAEKLCGFGYTAVNYQGSYSDWKSLGFPLVK